MLRQLSAKQLFAWQAFDLVEPFDDRRSTWQAAQMCAMLAANAGRQAKVSDFLLEFGGAVTEKPRKTWQQLKFIARQWVAACKPKENK